MKVICLDYGHGGHDPGAVGNGLKEKDLTLAIGKKVKGMLEKQGLKVIETRSDDRYVSLTERANISNRNKADALVSLHVNSASNPNARGFEIFTTRGQTPADKLADEIGKELQGAFPNVPFRADWSDGDLDKEENFTVIAKATAPACLVEMGFIVNAQDAAMLRTEQDKIAEAIARGIMNFLGIKYKGGSNVANSNNQSVSSWAQEAWRWATGKGVTDGSDPKGPVTREQAITMIYRALKAVGVMK